MHLTITVLRTIQPNFAFKKSFGQKTTSRYVKHLEYQVFLLRIDEKNLHWDQSIRAGTVSRYSIRVTTLN